MAEVAAHLVPGGVAGTSAPAEVVRAVFRDPVTPDDDIVIVARLHAAGRTLVDAEVRIADQDVARATFRFGAGR